jgi:flagellar basal body-associated protein FliL
VLGTSLVVVAVLSQLATAGLAIWMTLREPPRRVRLALLFLVLAIAGICATTWTAVRRREAVAVPAATVDKSPAPRAPRASLRVTTREVTTMGANQLVRVTIGFENEGDRAATEVQRVQMVNFILSPYGEEEAFRILRAELRSVGGETVSVAPAERLSFTIEGPRLVAGDFLPRGADEPQVARDSRPLLVAGIIRYRPDDTAEAAVEYCFYAMNPKVLVECSASGNPRPAAPRS